MSKKSAGLLVYRNARKNPELFLVHPRGPFWKNKDEGAWSIPKGEFSEDEDPLTAARREFREETGFEVSGDFIALDPLVQKSGKVVYCYAVEGEIDAKKIRSNTFDLEWPPKSGKIVSFSEVDKGEWFEMASALTHIHKGQADFLLQLESILNASR